MKASVGVGYPDVDAAVAASRACAAALGLDVHAAEVIAVGYSVRVLLQPAGVVTRIITEGQVLRGDPLPWLQREVGVAAFLASSEAAVVPPAADPGPHYANGVPLTLWEWVEAQPADLSQRQFGEMVFHLHQRLNGYEGELPFLVGPLSDIQAALRLSDNAVLHRVAEQLLPEVQHWPRHPIHGDAHTGNLLSAGGTWLWLDFEDACVGPPEWDFASRTTTEEAVKAYPSPLDPVLITRCRQLRQLQVLAALLTSPADPDGEKLLVELQAALATQFAQ